MNFIQQGIQNMVGWAFGIKDDEEKVIEARQKELAQYLSYYYGQHKKPLKVPHGGKDFNVISNHVKTIVDRSVSMLIGAGVWFDLPGEGETPESQFIDLVWESNKKYILLLDLVQYGSIYGTPAIKIMPEGRTTYRGTTYRLMAINPFNLAIFTNPNDIEDVWEYVSRWNIGQYAYREVTEKIDKTDPLSFWMVSTQKWEKRQWVNVSEPITWEYSFAPIAHGKNLPNAGNVYGYSDVEAIIDLQDKYNEGQSNENKILALNAFPQKYITGGKFPREKDDKGNETVVAGPSTPWEFPDPNTKVGQLAPSADLTSSNQFIDGIRRDLFEIAATVDSQSVKDKIGALTNFGLRVLFKNELTKNATKQLLYGDLLLDVNSRLLQLEGMEADPGKVNFGDPLPTNDTEVIDNLTKENALGVTSKETIAKELGRDWEVEQERLLKEKTQSTNAGAEVIRKFIAGG